MNQSTAIPSQDDTSRKRESPPPDPKDHAALAAQAESLVLDGRLSEAESAILLALKQNPTAPRYFMILGGIWTAQKRPRQALEAYQTAVRVEPASSPAHWRLGEALMRAGDLAKAESSLRRAIRLDPKVSPYHASLGALLMQQCFYEEAQASLNRAIRLDRKHPMARLYLAELLAMRGDMRGAEKTLKKARARAPHSIPVLAALCKLYEGQERTEEAIVCARALIECQPKNAAYHFRLSNQLGKAGRLDEALAVLSEASKLDPENRAYRAMTSKLTASVAGGQVAEPSKESAPAPRGASPAPKTGLFERVRLLWRAGKGHLIK